MQPIHKGAPTAAIAPNKISSPATKSPSGRVTLGTSVSPGRRNKQIPIKPKIAKGAAAKAIFVHEVERGSRFCKYVRTPSDDGCEKDPHDNHFSHAVRTAPCCRMRHQSLTPALHCGVNQSLFIGRPFGTCQRARELPAYRCVTFVKEPAERTQYLRRDCSMDLVNSREKLFLIVGSAALRRCSRRRGFSPDVLLLGGGFHQRSAKL